RTADAVCDETRLDFPGSRDGLEQCICGRLHGDPQVLVRRRIRPERSVLFWGQTTCREVQVRLGPQTPTGGLRSLRETSANPRIRFCGWVRLAMTPPCRAGERAGRC